MYVFKSLVAALVFAVASTSARPHGLRPRTCKHTGKTVTPSSTGVALPDNTAPVASSSVISSVAPSSTPSSDIPAPSSTPVSETPAHSSTPSASVQSSVRSSSAASSSVAPSATPSSSSSGNRLGSNSALAALFPVSQANSWTTSSSSSKSRPLSDAVLRPTKLLSALSHDYVEFQGKTAMQAHYPQGSYTFTHQPQGGLSFYAPGPSDIDLTTAKEATFGYSVFFEDGFDFNKGGKLPGLYGGDDVDRAASCSGGRRDDGCFSARFMWRTDGQGEMYTYLPPSFNANNAVCNVAPKSDCNSVYGASVGRGSFKFTSGKWTTISQRVRLNDAGKENGELELFADGQSIFTVTGLVLRDSDQGRIFGMQMQTFFGGSDSSWASPKDQNTWFSDFSVAITEKL